MMKKRMIALTLVLCMLLAGCAAKTNNNNANAESADTSTQLQYAYKAQYVPIDFKMDYFNNSCIGGDKLYMVANRSSEEMNENGIYESQSVLAVVDLATGKTEELPFYQPMDIPEGSEGSTGVSYMSVSEDGSLWIVDTLYTYSFDLPADFSVETDNEYDYYREGETKTRILHFAADGTLLSENPMPVIDGVDSMNLYVAAIDEKGHVYVTDYQNAYVLDESGKVVKEYPMESADLTTFCGKAAVRTYGETQKFQVIDSETLELGENMDTPFNAWSFLPSYDEAYDYYYETDGVIYGYNAESKQSTKVMSWMDWDVNPSNINYTYTLPDGSFLGINNNWESDTAQYELIIMTSVDPSTVPQKTTLRLACMYMDYDQRDKIVEFNKTHDNVRITIDDYSQYATVDDYHAGLTKLNTEILSGKIPDLMLTAEMPIEQYAARGYLEDLLPYLDKDEELSRDDLMENVLNTVCIDGKLYQAFSDFIIQTVAISKNVAEQFDTWTIADVHEAMKLLRDDATIFGVGYTRDAILYNYVGNSISRFVDWNAGKCDFDNDEFKGLLEFAKEFPETFDWDNYDWNDYVDGNTAVSNGSQLMTPVSVYGMEDFLYTLASLNNSAAFVGYPSTRGDGSNFLINTGLCMSSTCQDKDAAWEFIRTLFTEDYQKDRLWNGLPSNANVFNKQLEDIMTEEYETDENGEYLLDENGEKIVIPKTTFGTENGEVVITAMTQEQRDQFMELYESVHTLYSRNEAVYETVLEEANAYFADQKSLDEVAQMINSRVGLKVAESK